MSLVPKKGELAWLPAWSLPGFCLGHGFLILAPRPCPPSPRFQQWGRCCLPSSTDITSASLRTLLPATRVSQHSLCKAQGVMVGGDKTESPSLSSSSPTCQVPPSLSYSSLSGIEGQSLPLSSICPSRLEVPPGRTGIGSLFVQNL